MTVSRTEPKRPKRQKSNYYSKKKPLPRESERRVWEEKSFDDWDREKSRNYRREKPTVSSFNAQKSTLQPRHEEFSFDLSNPPFPTEFSQFRLDQVGLDKSEPKLTDSKAIKERKQYTPYEQTKQSRYSPAQYISRREDTNFVADPPGSEVSDLRIERPKHAFFSPFNRPKREKDPS